MAIRIYAFACDKCAYEFTIEYDWDKILGYKPKCPNCKSKETYRNYSAQNVIFNDGNPKTVGGLADKHAIQKKVDFK